MFAEVLQNPAFSKKVFSVFKFTIKNRLSNDAIQTAIRILDSIAD